MNVLVVNAGSSSLKYQFIETDSGLVYAKGVCERIGSEGSSITHKQLIKDIKVAKEAPMKDHADAMKLVVDALTDAEIGCVASMDEIEAIGHRVVHGGAYFSKSILVDDEVISKLELCKAFAHFTVESCFVAYDSYARTVLFAYAKKHLLSELARKTCLIKKRGKYSHMRNIKYVFVAYGRKTANGKHNHLANVVAVKLSEAFKTCLHYFGKLLRAACARCSPPRALRPSTGRAGTPRRAR